ncbi:TetR/AcrR family transcriptional regulator [Isoptericola sp. b408]|uniref:TetR/AcrR family transcriptional regulator n=1 Tax=Isoptericola sp. b408 TaxID=3064653 RepID=UPI002712D09F|nr:TetR/AcrR family transcriptional regulator [Isoptericola sp. b408]MDO8149921.1 TetR/AcrR family transcriptional regulator [Isoptericola sp. b408]
MGRAQTFDTDEVVRAALGVFWRSGYEATSVPTLEQATGLNRSSLYHAFGSKRGLFDAAVQAYLDDVVRPRLRPLVADPVGPDAVVDYVVGLRSALLRADSIQADSGCLLVNTSGSPISRDETVRRTVAAYRAELRSALGRGVDARFTDRGAVERERVADLCTALVVSAFATVRVDPAGAVSALDGALGLLEAEPT